MERDRLRVVIRDKLASGELPHDSIPRIWGDPGNGEKCDACEEVVRTGQLLMEGISAVTNRAFSFTSNAFPTYDRGA